MCSNRGKCESRSSFMRGDSDIGHPQKSGQNSEGRVAGKHLHCRAEWLMESFIHPFVFPCGPGSLGLTFRNFSLPSQRWNSGGRVVPLQCSFHSGWKNVLATKLFENSGGFHQTPPASMVRILLIKGTADSTLKKVDNQIRSKMNGKRFTIF